MGGGVGDGGVVGVGWFGGCGGYKRIVLEVFSHAIGKELVR